MDVVTIFAADEDVIASVAPKGIAVTGTIDEI